MITPCLRLGNGQRNAADRSAELVQCNYKPNSRINERFRKWASKRGLRSCKRDPKWRSRISKRDSKCCSRSQGRHWSHRTDRTEGIERRNRIERRIGIARTQRNPRIRYSGRKSSDEFVRRLRLCSIVSYSKAFPLTIGSSSAEPVCTPILPFHGKYFCTVHALVILSTSQC